MPDISTASLSLVELSEVVRNFTFAIAGLGAATVGLWLAWWRVSAARDQARAAGEQSERAREVHFTEVLAKAVEQLGNDALTVRLGGIYALGRLSGESKKDHWAIIKLLCSFIQERSPAVAKTGEYGEIIEHIEKYQIGRFSADVQAALTLIGTRNREFDPPNAEINLTDCDLTDANVQGMDFSKTNFDGSNLTVLNAEACNFKFSTFRNCSLRAADFLGANLEGAQIGRPTDNYNFRLAGTNLKDSIIGHCDLSSVTFAHCRFENTLFADVDFTKAVYLPDVFPNGCEFEGKIVFPDGKTKEFPHARFEAQMRNVD